MTHDQPLLSIVIPAYNETARLGATLGAIRDYAGRTGRRIEVVVVDDGSVDGTSALATGFDPGPLTVRVLTSPVNRGKGQSVRKGMLAAEGDLLLMCDADGSTPIQEVEKLLPHLDAGFSVAIGSRWLAGAHLPARRAMHRRLMGWVFRHLRRRLILPEIVDTQCGFKCFTRSAGRELFARQTVLGFAFDCEILALACQAGYRIKEVGITWRDDPRSHLRPVRDSLRMLADVFRLRRRL